MFRVAFCFLLLCFSELNFAQENSSRYTKTLRDTEFESGDLILAPDITFRDSRLNNPNEESIQHVIWFFERNPFLIAEIIVHTGCRGATYYNEYTSLLQAKALVNYITSGDSIFDERLTPVGKGKNDLLYTCDYLETIKNDSSKYEAYHKANFRVEIKITGFLGNDFYRNQGEASRLNNLHPSRDSNYYEDLVFIADKALLEGNYQKALEYYQRAINIGPPTDSYPSEQVKKIKELLQQFYE